MYILDSGIRGDHVEFGGRVGPGAYIAATGSRGLQRTRNACCRHGRWDDLRRRQRGDPRAGQGARLRRLRDRQRRGDRTRLDHRRPPSRRTCRAERQHRRPGELVRRRCVPGRRSTTASPSSSPPATTTCRRARSRPVGCLPRSPWPRPTSPTYSRQLLELRQLRRRVRSGCQRHLVVEHVNHRDGHHPGHLDGIATRGRRGSPDPRTVAHADPAQVAAQIVQDATIGAGRQRGQPDRPTACCSSPTWPCRRSCRSCRPGCSRPGPGCRPWTASSSGRVWCPRVASSSWLSVAGPVSRQRIGRSVERDGGRARRGRIRDRVPVRIGRPQQFERQLRCTMQRSPTRSSRSSAPQGRVCLFTNSATHLVVDVNGYFPAGSQLRVGRAGTGARRLGRACRPSTGCSPGRAWCRRAMSSN